MAKLAEQLERKAFSAAIDVALRRINKDREKGLLEIVARRSGLAGNRKL